MNKHNQLQKYLDKGTSNSLESTEFLELITGGPLSFARVLKSHRECEEYSQQELAEKLGLSKQYISQLENGKLPSIETAAKIARVFEMSEESFVRYVLQDLLNQAGISLEVELKPKKAS